MQFTKMHGIGNDYVYLNGFDPGVVVADPAALARVIADRHTGVGGDGLILLLPPDTGGQADPERDAHVLMRMFNADGSEAEMCGNGIRCVCKLAHDSGTCTANPMRIQTGNGVLSLDYTLGPDGKVDSVTVDMGEPILDLPRIPVVKARLDDAVKNGIFVSMGNPHVTFYRPDVATMELASIGPAIEHHPAFPRRINAHWVQVHSEAEVTMRTWERGSGITQACGTGACAVCVAGVLAGKTGRDITAHLPGGDLQLRWDEKTNHVFMTGPATTVFTGDWPV